MAYYGLLVAVTAIASLFITGYIVTIVGYGNSMAESASNYHYVLLVQSFEYAAQSTMPAQNDSSASRANWLDALNISAHADGLNFSYSNASITIYVQRPYFYVVSVQTLK
ncbi:MAG: hypothetical protein KGH98_03535 [Candidatus Micrarchaeota archaeon]|nr:hypothetical protein [Candidatus Micrarchaeota archaeon]